MLNRIEHILRPFEFQIRWFFRGLGYEFTRYEPNQYGNDPFNDMQRLCKSADPVIFDIGANTGQTTRRFKQYFPKSHIHAFEPSPITFQVLSTNTADLQDVVVQNIGCGSQEGEAVFFENSSHDMSSFLQPDRDSWGKVVRKRQLPMTTVDRYCADNQITHIDILKSDTQGYELEVLMGTTSLLGKGAVHLIYLEIIFSQMYSDIPRFDEIYKFLAEHDFLLVTFYRFHFQNGVAGWTDALFIHRRHWENHFRNSNSNTLASTIT